MTLGALHFGGPDLPARALRDLLQVHVDASPPGSSIDWCTYYFRDEALAESLIRASDRGVMVTLTLESEPRRKSANADVIERLAAHGLNGGLRIFAPRGPLHPHLHAKIYAFSAPRPIAFIGSFNPSGNEPEDADVIAEIGDQDRGHNLLLGIEDPVLVEALRLHAATIPKRGGLIGSRLTQNRVIRSGNASLFFYPRLRSGQVERELSALGTGDRIHAAISHLKGTGFVTALGGAAQRGAQVDLVVHDTERRVPERDLASLRDAGALVRRFRHPQGLPMHAKFLLIDRSGQPPAAWLGSANFNPRSRWINQEVLLRTTDAETVKTLLARFDTIAADPCCDGA
jgi:phosphatidylserine/phosphatidylglycerophosphate/cardiolipin synthase-like enzyme